MQVFVFSSPITLIELDATLRQANKSMDVVVPLECFTMINTITAIRMQLFSLCNRHESEVTAETQSGDKSDSPGELSMSQPTSVSYVSMSRLSSP